MYTPTTPVTGGLQTGFTAPTYTLVADTAPDSNGKQNAVSALGGTQTGVDVSSVSRPFTATFVRPKVLRTLGSANPVTGVISNVPNNVYEMLIRKGVTPLAGQASRTMTIRVSIAVPAGSDTADAPNVKAALSLAAGLLSQQSAGIGDTLLTGTF